MGLDFPLFSELGFFCCTSESVCRKRQCLTWKNYWSFTISLKVKLFPNADSGLFCWHFFLSFFFFFFKRNESRCFESQECLMFSGITFIDMFPFPLQMAPVFSLSTFHNISTRGWENDEEISQNWLLILCYVPPSFALNHRSPEKGLSMASYIRCDQSTICFFIFT